MWRYDGKHGGVFRVSEPRIEPYVVRGRTAREALRGVHDYGERTGHLALFSRYHRYSHSNRHRDRDAATGKHKIEKSFELISTFKIVLPEWDGYDAASPADRRLWDMEYCRLVHHERGHMMIDLEVRAETLSYIMTYRGDTVMEVAQAVGRRQMQTFTPINARQELYHTLSGAGTRTGWATLPYEAYDWPWRQSQLSADNGASAELHSASGDAP